ncbi:4-beta-glucanase) [Durusdinium trenchii]|uniref:4-beta-glucanase n=1 Tax=Durusdinium trenchii TaxID=1381693 RepID=A0ABP0RRP2_9DINO
MLGTWPDVEPVLPDAQIDADWLKQFPLKTKGRHIVTQAGERFRLRGVNWYGASDCKHVVGGLDIQNLDTICSSISALGFNTVRLPFSNEMLRSSVCGADAIDRQKNPSLDEVKPLEAFDAVIHALGRWKIAVVLNNHTSHGEWCGGPDRNGLWFDPSSDLYTEEQWIEDWAMLARRYRHCPYVVGFDLRNEVRFCPWPFRWATAKRWAAAAQRCGVRVREELQEEMRLLVVERIIWPMRSLEAYAAEGVLLPEWSGHLVLGVHHYSWNGPGRYLTCGHVMKGCMGVMKNLLRCMGVFSPQNYGDMDPDQLKEVLQRQWGFLLSEDRCPVWVSEFGSGSQGYDFRWLSRFVEILGKMEVDFAYWPLNVGPKPGCGGDESYGMLAADWTLKEEPDERLELLRHHGLLPSAAPSRHCCEVNG